MKYFFLYLLAFVSFLVIDFIWLGFISKDFYKNNIGHLMLDKFKIGPAIVFYLLFLIGLLVFVIVPGIHEGSLKKLILRAVLFGMVTYGTYDLTNWATLEGWPVKVVVVDIIWGASLSSLVSFSVYFINNLFNIYK